MKSNPYKSDSLSRLKGLETVGRSGKLQLHFAEKHGKTILKDAYCEIPFKITRLHQSHASKIAHLMLMNPTAGTFGGDDLTLEIWVEAGAHIVITTQGSPKIYPSAQALEAKQQVNIHVQAGATLQYLAEPTIPFADSQFSQNWQIHLDSDSQFLYWDGMMSGRILYGEKWKFCKFATDFQVFIDDQISYLERYQLEPSRQEYSDPLQMGSHSYLGTLLAFAPSLMPSLQTEVWREQLSSDLILGIDFPQAHLLLGRVLSENGVGFRKARDWIFSYLQGQSAFVNPILMQ